MVLSVMTMLMLAVMMTIGFNISHSVHERIRLQSAADAQAYSVAVMQARSLNVNAVINRTIAALTVAQMSLHAWNNLATHDVDMLFGGFMGFLGVSATEASQCSIYTPWHCWDAFEAFLIALDYLNAYNDYKGKLESKEREFNDAVKALYESKKSLYDQELAFVDRVDNEIRGQGIVLQRILQTTAPQARYTGGLHTVNSANYKCSLSGPEDDIRGCGGAEPLVFNRPDVPPAERSRMMQNAANAARGLFNTWGGEGAMLTHEDFKGNTPFTVNNPRKMMNIQGSGQYNAVYIPGAFASRVGDSTFSKASRNSELAENVGAGVGFGGVSVQWRHGYGGFPLGSNVFSSLQGGQHQFGLFGIPGGDSNHREFKTIARQPGEATFVTFRAHDNPGPDNDWGQPNAYGGVTQDLRLLQSGGRGAYEVNDQGTVTVKIGNEQHRIELVPQQNALAIAKAKAYFHQFGQQQTWALPPNGFDPFWRAKLHPFKADELRAALSRAGDRNAGIRGPVEGVVQ
jgi:hypothetical protein